MKLWLATCASAAGTLLVSVLFLRGQAPGEAADPPKDKRTITTSGTATLKVKPDAARVYFGVQTVAKTIQEARKENSSQSRKVVNALRALNIPDLKMKTADINVQVVNEQKRDELHLPKILGYQVTNSFTALVQDKDAARLGANASRVLDTALENGANLVQQIVAFREDEAEIRREGLSKAVEAGLANAGVGPRSDPRKTYPLLNASFLLTAGFHICDRRYPVPLPVRRPVISRIAFAVK
jgi:uncharacterized protein YggE